MNKPDIVRLVADKINATQKSTEEVIDALFDIITEQLANHEDILFSGFGKFAIQFKPSHEGIKPCTSNEPYIYRDKYNVQFFPSRKMKALVDPADK